MTVLDFTKKTTPVIDKLIKLGFHYESTDKTEAEGIRNPPQLITTWENVMNGVILKIIDTYAVSYDEYYDYFGLPNILEALDKWDKQYGKVVENRG